MGRKKLSKIQQLLLFDGLSVPQEQPQQAKKTEQTEATKKIPKPKNQQIVVPKILGRDNWMNIQGGQVSFDFVHRVEDFLLENNIKLNSRKFLLGVSGGSDSLAMLLAFYYLRNKYDLKLLVSHINYNLRGEQSAADQRLLQKICFEKNILVEIKSVDAGALSEKGLRDLRFEEFEKIAKRDKIKNLCLAHNKNDQVETVLFNVVRGAGISGAAGIKQTLKLASGLTLIHPLLHIDKKQIVAFLQDQKVQWAEDATNAEPIYSRNKIRLELLPWLKENLNPKAMENIFEFSTILSQTHQFWQEQASSKLKRLKIKGESEPGVFCFSVEKLKKELPLLRYYLFKEIYEEFTGEVDGFYRNHFSQIEKLFESQGSVKINLFEKMVLLKEYDNLYIFDHDLQEEHPEDQPMVFSKLAKVFVFNNCRIRMSKVNKIPAKFDKSSVAYLDYGKLQMPLVVRSAVAGDRFVPVGMKGHKKLKEFFIDEKVCKFERKRIPIITDTKGIVWVGGYRVDARAVAKSSCKNVLKIELERLEKSRSAQRKK